MSGNPPPRPFFPPGMPRPGMPPGMPPPGMLRPPYGGGPPMYLGSGAPRGPSGMQPPPGMYPPGAPVMRPGYAGQQRPGDMMLPVRVPKATSVFVGKIAPTVEDRVMLQLLEACGKIRQWKRMQDPETKQPKSFGLCDYEDAEGVLRAIRLLNGVKLDGSELLLKCNTSTAKYIEQYESNKEQMRSSKAASAEQGELVSEDNADQEKDNDVLALVMTLLSERGDGAAAKPEALPLELPGPPPDRPRDDARAEQERERQMEREFEMEREAERRKERKRIQEAEAAYSRKLKDWEMYEISSQNRRDKERSKARDLEKERARAIRADLDAIDSDDELEPWARKPYAASRRAEDRRKRRAREEAEDDKDRQAEAEEEAKRPRYEAPRHQAVADVAADGPHGQQRHHGEANGQREVKMEPEFDPTDPIYQAMIAASKAPPVRLPSPPASKHEPKPEEFKQEVKPEAKEEYNPFAASPGAALPYQQQQQQPTGRQPAAAAVGSRPSGRKQNVMALFGDDDEETKSRRQLKPIQYTDEELRAVHAAPATAGTGSAAGAAAAASDPAADTRRIMDAIPVSKEDVFNYKVKWEMYDPQTTGSKLSSWLAKKIQALLGMEENDLVNYVMELINRHASAAEVSKELFAVLDAESESFTLRLYRMIIYETEKAVHGIKDPVPAS